MFPIHTISLQYIFHFPLNKLVKPAYWKSEEWMRDNKRLFAVLPKDVGVATQQNIVSPSKS